jgi:hypothetical protein
MKSSKILLVILVLQAAILAGQWLGQPNYISPARAQLPETGSIQIQMLDQLKQINVSLDKIIELLASGEVQVKVASPDEKKEPAPIR